MKVSLKLSLKGCFGLPSFQNFVQKMKSNLLYGLGYKVDEETIFSDIK